jgi:hypothetical protein
MAQRWMQAKDMLARKHGVARSGASRPMGDVMDDRLPRVYAEPKPAPIKRDVVVYGRHVATVSAIKRKVNGTVVVLKSDRPKAWTYTGADAFTC